MLEDVLETICSRPGEGRAVSERGLQITVIGHEGSGKGTALPVVARELNCHHVDMGDELRKISREQGLSLEANHAGMAKDRSIDDILDTRVHEIFDTYPRLLMASRTAWALRPESVRVLMTCRPMVGAERVAKRQNISVDDALRMNRERVETDGQRYLSQGKVPEYPPDLCRFDIVLDTSDIDPEEVVRRLVEEIQFFDEGAR